MSHHQFAEHAEGFFEEMVAKIYARYEQILKGADGQDFGDLIVSTVRLLREDEEVLQYYQDRFRYVMIDEYQDTNRAQYALVRELARGGATWRWWATTIRASMAGEGRISAT